MLDGLRNLVLLGLLIFMSNVTFGQTEKRNTLSFQIGPSIPVGPFADSDIESDDEGFARTGINIELSYNHQLKKKWGYVISAKISSYRFDMNTYLDEHYYPVDERWDYSADNYNIFGLYSGPYFALLQQRIISVYVNGLIGINLITNPNVSITSPVFEYFTNADPVLRFAYALKTASTFRLSNKISISVSVEYFHTKAKHEIAWSSKFQGALWEDEETYSHPISAFNLGLGVIYNLK